MVAIYFLCTVDISSCVVYVSHIKVRSLIHLGFVSLWSKICTGVE